MTFDIETGGMMAHAGKVDGLSNKAAQAEQAARSVSFHPETYGMIGAALVYPLIAPLEAAGVAAAASATASLTATATGVREAVKGLEVVDDAVNIVLTEIKEKF